MAFSFRPSTQTFIYLFIHSLIHSVSQPAIDSATHWIIHSFIPSFIHWFVEPFVSSFHPIHSSIHSCIPAFMQSCMHSYIETFAQSRFHTGLAVSLPIRLFVWFNELRFSFACLWRHSVKPQHTILARRRVWSLHAMASSLGWLLCHKSTTLNRPESPQ